MPVFSKLEYRQLRDLAMLGPMVHPTTGNIYYVHSSGANTNAGNSSAAPLATIDAAIGLCTANHGDLILVMPGHTENVATATALVPDVAGVQIIGMGQGNTRPVLSFTAVAGNIPVTAANVRISNIVLSAGIASVTVPLTISGANCEIDHCLWTFSTTAFSFITCLLTAAGATYLYVHDNVFETEVGNATSTRGITMVGLLKPRIQRNRFYGTWGDAVIFQVTTLSSQMDLSDNVIYNSDTTVYNCIDFGGLASTGNIYNNVITGLYTTTAIKLFRNTTSACSWSNNYFANSILERGSILVPATSSV